MHTCRKIFLIINIKYRQQHCDVSDESDYSLKVMVIMILIEALFSNIAIIIRFSFYKARDMIK